MRAANRHHAVDDYRDTAPRSEVNYGLNLFSMARSFYGTFALHLALNQLMPMEAQYVNLFLLPPWGSFPVATVLASHFDLLHSGRLSIASKQFRPTGSAARGQTLARTQDEPL